MSEESQFLKELHKTNSCFLNNALFGIPAVGIPLVIYILIGFSNGCILIKLCLWLTFVSFSISTSILLWSFFVAEKTIEYLEQKRKEDSLKKNHLVKRLNRWTFYCVLLGFLFIVIAAALFTFNFC